MAWERCYPSLTADTTVYRPCVHFQDTTGCIGLLGVCMTVLRWKESLQSPRWETYWWNFWQSLINVSIPRDLLQAKYSKCQLISPIIFTVQFFFWLEDLAYYKITMLNAHMTSKKWDDVTVTICHSHMQWSRSIVLLEIDVLRTISCNLLHPPVHIIIIHAAVSDVVRRHF